MCLFVYKYFFESVCESTCVCLCISTSVIVGVITYKRVCISIRRHKDPLTTPDFLSLNNVKEKKQSGCSYGCPSKDQIPVIANALIRDSC